MSENEVVKQIFSEGRTHRFFTDKPVSETVLRQLYERAKFAPTASNLCPMRVSFVQSDAQKQKVIEAAAEGNKAKIESAPVVAIIACDTRFFDHVETLSPHMDAAAFRRQDLSVLDKMAVENSWLQAGFLIAAARTLGLDCGPMAGFDKAKIDEAFYKNSPWRSLFLMNLGYGDKARLHPRGYRFSFEESCSII